MDTKNSLKEITAKDSSTETLLPSWNISSKSFDIQRKMPAPVDMKALRMMEKMGYKPGSGLGKNEQGVTEAIKIDTNLGKRGLGHKINNLNLSDESWDFSQEELIVEEKVNWLLNSNVTVLVEVELEKWIKEGPRTEDVINNSAFCNRSILQGVFKGKDIFDELDLQELGQARTKANPFETVRSVFFMNRAALKMANIDAATDFIFTTMEEHNYFSQEKYPIYFADVCAGPGGFTEYILWRKKWFYKGFGLTLKDEHDFKVSDSTCASSVTFQALYGSAKDGDVCNPENLSDFTDRVKNETDGKGVHFMMSDGGFCVDGNENLQEILSKNIYICQCLLALQILRPHGCFVTKVFDIFTPFSIGLLYLMYLCFEKVGIIKPNSSRPANSERYFICSNFKMNPLSNLIREYLWKIVIRLWEIKNLPDRGNMDILEIVPIEVLKNDESFLTYIINSNNRIGKKQIIALKKLAQFCRYPNLIDARQEELRRQCLEYWKIPDEKRKVPEICKVKNVLEQIDFACEILRVQPRHIKLSKQLDTSLVDLKEWHYTYMFSSIKQNRTNFYAGLSNSKVYRLQNTKWVKVKDLQLPQGTLLHGEFIKETTVSPNEDVSFRYSLHVIDAIFLGTVNLQQHTFPERVKLINIFCKSVNKESQPKYSVRVRPKHFTRLSDILNDCSLTQTLENQSPTMYLPRIGFQAKCEKYEVNSMLLLKTTNCQSFQSTHVLRLQLLYAKENENDIQSISFKELKELVQKRIFMCA